MNTENNTQPTQVRRPGLRRLSYVRQGESVDPKTGEVFRTIRYEDGTVGSYVRGYVTERWARNHGWID